MVPNPLLKDVERSSCFMNFSVFWVSVNFWVKSGLKSFTRAKQPSLTCRAKPGCLTYRPLQRCIDQNTSQISTRCRARNDGGWDRPLKPLCDHKREIQSSLTDLISYINFSPSQFDAQHNKYTPYRLRRKINSCVGFSVNKTMSFSIRLHPVWRFLLVSHFNDRVFF